AGVLRCSHAAAERPGPTPPGGPRGTRLHRRTAHARACRRPVRGTLRPASRRARVMPAEAPAASVIVPTYRRRASVLRLCEALAKQTLPPERYELIVSIDGSEDGTREALEALHPPYALSVLWQPNRGRAAALNAGIRCARGMLVVLLDDDMEPAPELLQAHIRAHADGTPRGVMGAVPVHIDAGAPPAKRYIGEKFNRHLENLRRPDYTLRFTDF